MVTNIIGDQIASAGAGNWTVTRFFDLSGSVGSHVAAALLHKTAESNLPACS